MLQSPSDYSRRILLAVEAYSPQTITETLYSLTQQNQPPYVPTEIRLITTERGYQLVHNALIEQGWLRRLCDDYTLPDCCSKPTFHVIQDQQGEALWDIQTEQDNEVTADFISQQVQHLTVDENASLCVLLSGGRRTMTYYIGYALSLFGRPQDRLKHVRVDDRYYYIDNFYYPPPRSECLTDRLGESFDASQVKIMLADIPFVRLRSGLPESLLQGGASFSASVAAVQRSLVAPVVRLDWQKAQLFCADTLITMPPVQMAFYAWMLQRRQQDLPPVGRQDMAEPVMRQAFLNIYRRLHGATANYEQVAAALHNDDIELLRAWFDERKSKVNAALQKALGMPQAQAYLLHPHGQRPRTCFGVTLTARVIDIDQ
ncbi:MAG: TIGR02584 family CRISPR-associated protein [Proteobacteria bacterium]|nr:MAG: TIGR02584 family CRISPR-associated protein [Pseudomonadota bacterium]